MSTYMQSMLIFTLIICITVCGLYIMTGLTGMFSMGSAAFMAIGAYTGGLLCVKLGLGKGAVKGISDAFVPYAGFIGCIVASILVACILGYVIGSPIMRLRRDYFTLVTLGFGEAIIAFLNQAVDITGGAMGIIGISRRTNLAVAIIATVLAIIFAVNFRHSRFGRQAMAVRGDELAAKSMGISVAHTKMRSFLVAASFAAVAGCLYAFYIRYADPTLFNWQKSGEWVIMVFFGGVNSLTGSIFATFLLNFLPQLLNSLYQYRLLIYSALVLLIINFKPDGLFGHTELHDLIGMAINKIKGSKKKGEN